MIKSLPPKFKFIYDEYKDKNFALLDIGCGNYSVTMTKALFKNCRYTGVDRQNYNNSEADYSLMEKFYEINLEDGNIDSVPDNSFDVIILAHVIEHLSNGLEVIEMLTRKLKKGGLMYIEYPSVRSLNFPSMKGTLHFCDDPTHIKLYDVKEICNLLLAHGFKIHRAGVLRMPMKIIFIPVLILYHLIRGTLGAGVFWYVLGFSEFVYARKLSAD